MSGAQGLTGEMIIADPPSNIRKFAREVGCPWRVISRVIKRLESEGVIAPRRRSGQFLWELALEEILAVKSGRVD